jgi:hypothetical protein
VAKSRSAATWDALKPSYRARLERGGITRGKYISGESLSGSRGHAKTPEHGIKDAIKRPEKYKDYINKKTPTGGGGAPVNRDDLEDQALRSMDTKVGDYLKYRRDSVIGRIKKMTVNQLRMTIAASEDDIVQLARPQHKSNPWHYH